MTNKKNTPSLGEDEAKQPNEVIVAQDKQVVKEMDIDGFLAKRQEFIQKVNSIMVEGKDYHVIQGKKSLAKGGAEKIASIFGWVAGFEKDDSVLEAFKLEGLIGFVCNLTKHSEFVGQGRGAATLGRNNVDPNKTIKMAQKSAFIDAVIRASGMSDFFTQDLGPEDEGSNYNHVKQPTEIKNNEGKKPTERQSELIKKLALQKHVKQTQLKEMADGLTPSELIDRLLRYQTPVEDKELERVGDDLEY